MHPQKDIERVASTLLESKGLRLASCKPIQTLWAGYGHICEIQAVPAEPLSEKTLSLILKYVHPPVKSGKRQDEGHLRKVISYQVEQYFYANLTPSMPKDVAVASCVASIDKHDASGNITAMILSDLREDFPSAGERRGNLSSRQIDAAVDWLAGFHGFWWSRTQSFPREQLRRPPLEEAKLSRNEAVTANLEKGGVWLNGGYTYLATRRSEYANLAEDEDNEWSQKLCCPMVDTGETVAENVALFLSPLSEHASTYETLIHGDVKSENLFTTTRGDAVAFFDFQYVGLGYGVCDLAKLFTCSVSERILRDGAADGLMHAGEQALLRRYLKRLTEVSQKPYDWEIFVRHWETALVDWLRFQASWGFWGNTEWLEARVTSILEDQSWREWLIEKI